MIVFGGFGGFDFAPGAESFFNDVWVLSKANGQGSPVWTQLSPPGTPPARRCYKLVPIQPTA